MNFQNAGTAIAMPISAPVTSVFRLRSSWPSADLKPRTASTKHSAPLKLKPIVLISAAAAGMPADTPKNPGQ